MNLKGSREVFFYISPSLAFFDNTIPLVYDLKDKGYVVVAILRDQKILLQLSHDKYYRTLLRIFDHVIYSPIKNMQCCTIIPSRFILSHTLFRWIYFTFQYGISILFKINSNKILFSKNPSLQFSRLHPTFDKLNSALVADITALQKEDSISINELKGIKLVSILHGIELGDKKIANEHLCFGASHITELYFSPSSLYATKQKEIKLIPIPRHNQIWRKIYINKFSNRICSLSDCIVVFSDPDRRFAYGEKSDFFYAIFSAARILKKNVIISPHPKEYSFVTIKQAADKANFKFWRVQKINPMVIEKDTLCAITFGSSIDWDLAYYEVPTIILDRLKEKKSVQISSKENGFLILDDKTCIHPTLIEVSKKEYRTLIIQKAKLEYGNRFMETKLEDLTSIAKYL